MGDDISWGCVCYDFRCGAFLHSTAEYVVYGWKMTLDDNLSLNPNRCHHPLITQLSFETLEIKLLYNIHFCCSNSPKCKEENLEKK